MRFSLLHLVQLAFWLYYLLILARCVLSWLRTPSYTSPWLPLWRLVYGATEPLLAPIRKVLSRYTRAMPLDFSPFILILLLSVVERIIIRALAGPF